MKPEYAKVYAFDPEMITNLPFVHYKTKKFKNLRHSFEMLVYGSERKEKISDKTASVIKAG